MKIKYRVDVVHDPNRRDLMFIYGLDDFVPIYFYTEEEAVQYIEMLNNFDYCITKIYSKCT